MTDVFEGIVVLDLSRGISGPYAAQCLADFGASVTKVELPEGDFVRQLGPPDGTSGAAMFEMLNRNKSGLVLDYRTPQGADQLRQLLDGADVVVEDLTAEEWSHTGIDPEGLTADHPRLVHCAISAMGRSGSWSDKAVTELELQGIVGMPHYLDRADAAPVRVGADVCSMAAGQVAYQGIVAALYSREQTGQGQRVDVSQLQSAISLSAVMFGALDNPDEWNGHHCMARGNDPDYGYETADEPFYFGQGLQTEQPWLDLCERFDLNWVNDDPRFSTRQGRAVNAPALKPILEEVFRHHPRTELMELLNDMGNIAVPVNDHRAVIDHPQTAANAHRITVTLEDGSVTDTLGLPWALSETPGSIRHGAPALATGESSTAEWKEGHAE